MKKFISFIIAALIFTGAKSQTKVRQDANGNYISYQVTKDSTKTSAKPTGKIYTDAKGNKYPVMVSKNGNLFIVRISKTGNKYNQYLKLD